MTVRDVTDEVLRRVLEETTGNDSESIGVRLDCRIALAGDPSWSHVQLAKRARQRVCDYLIAHARLN